MSPAAMTSPPAPKHMNLVRVCRSQSGIRRDHPRIPRNRGRQAISGSPSPTGHRVINPERSPAAYLPMSSTSRSNPTSPGWSRRAWSTRTGSRPHPHNSTPFGSVVALVVRAGNPKNIHTWSDLLKPGVEVITPNPASSGSAKWNLLAPYLRGEQRWPGSEPPGWPTSPNSSATTSGDPPSRGARRPPPSRAGRATS